MNGPWDNWIPGVLNKRQMLELSKMKLLRGIDDVVGEASLDLSLSNEAYRMKEGSVKPTGSNPYGVHLSNEDLAERIEVEEGGVFTLDRQQTYVFKLQQRLHGLMADIGIWGRATAKSSVGRVDVLARLIVDGMDQYERFDAPRMKNQSGDMYLEVTPITFRVKVKVGKCLSQLRLFYGEPEDAEISGEQIFRTVFKGSAANDGSLSVDLTNTDVRGLQVAAFCADSPGDDPVCLWKSDDLADPCKPWRFKASSGPDRRLRIENNKFYILRSKEKIWVPSGIAIYCRASDETTGGMRIHYAGFVHPHFGAVALPLESVSHS
jgi:dCTP deaminase